MDERMRDEEGFHEGVGEAETFHFAAGAGVAPDSQEADVAGGNEVFERGRLQAHGHEESIGFTVEQVGARGIDGKGEEAGVFDFVVFEQFGDEPVAAAGGHAGDNLLPGEHGIDKTEAHVVGGRHGPGRRYLER